MVVRLQRFPSFRPGWNGVFNFDQEVGTLCNSLLGGTVASGLDQIPAMDMQEIGNEILVTLELPGIPREAIKISAENGILTISGERKDPGTPEGSKWIRNEIPTGKFVRKIEIPHKVNAEKITAEMANGILRIVLPKAEETRLREITIQ